MNIENVVSFFGNLTWLAVFVIALIPFFEGRIAFSFALNESLLKENVLSPFFAIVVCFMASVFLSLFLLAFFKTIFSMLKKVKWLNKILTKIDETIKIKSEKVKEKNNRYIYLALFVFIPLPLTGVYTACLIASFLNLNFYKSLFFIVLGNLGCLLLLFVLNMFLKDFTLWLILICFLISLLVILITKLKNIQLNISFLSD